MIVASGLMVRAGRGDDRRPRPAARAGPARAAGGHGRRCSPASRRSTCTATGATWRPSTGAYDETVATVGGMWANKDFQARIRLSALLLGQLATAVPDVGSHDRDDLVVRAAELVEAARRAARLREESVWDEGPEGRAWLARVEAEHARFRWLVGDDPPDARRPGRPAGERAVAGLRGLRPRLRAGPLAGAAGRGAQRRRPHRRGRRADRRRGGGGPVARRRAAAARAAHPRRPRPGVPETTRRDEPLTAREQEVLALVAQGRSNREIAGPAVHQRQDGQRARVEHAGQARRRRPHRGGRGGPPPRLPRRLTALCQASQALRTMSPGPAARSSRAPCRSSSRRRSRPVRPRPGGRRRPP